MASGVGITDVATVSWTAGVEAAYASDGRSAFVTPPIDGWVLVAGVTLFGLAGSMKTDTVKLPDRIRRLSETLSTQVQYFATHRVSEAHQWVSADKGVLVRAFSIGDGEVEFDVGARTAAEKEVASSFKSDRVDEDWVLRLAGRWSVDPGKLDGRWLPRGLRGVFAPGP
ncbi:MAG: hypothetical protein IPJ34_26860 [Myxococcales bacterium]|nr:hypothetical protein [Myxococcales bacterium]